LDQYELITLKTRKKIECYIFSTLIFQLGLKATNLLVLWKIWCAISQKFNFSISVKIEFSLKVEAW